MSEELKIALAGAGAITERAHIPAFRALPEVRIVAVQSRSRTKPERLAGMFWRSGEQSRRPRTYADFGEMLRRERPDAVGIFTPNDLHCRYALEAFAAGAHVLVEKPMAPTTAEARRMVETARASGRVLMVAMQRRYGVFEMAAREALVAGAIGTPHFIRARLSHGGPEFWAPGQEWFFSASHAGGGAMLDLGVHAADLALWMMGQVEAVTGQVRTLSKAVEVEDNGAMLLNFSSGGLGVIEASWTSAPGLSGVEIYGSGGRVMMGYPGVDFAVQGSDGTPVPGYSREEVLTRTVPHGRLAASHRLAQAFVGAVMGERNPDPSGEDGMRAVELIEACYRSARRGRKVRLPLA